MATHESRDLTALCGVRLLPDDFARGTELARARGLTLPSLLRSMLLESFDEAEGHVYLSTACRHADDPGREGENLHDECKTNMIRPDGTEKKPAECKHCGAPCICPCHQEATDAR